MPWNPAVRPGEVVLVACNVEARRRVPFHCVLTDQRLIYGRSTVWALDGLVTESCALADVSDVRLKRLRPFALWLFGAFAALGVVTAIYGSLTGENLRLGWYGAVLMLAAAAISFGGARKRWALHFRVGKRRRELTTPLGSHDGVRTQMAEALQEIDRLLRDPGARTLTARSLHLERESEQERDPEEEDRELCPDGNCTGVLGADGKCPVCGISGRGA
jgi:hypothetical protein